MSTNKKAVAALREKILDKGKKSSVVEINGLSIEVREPTLKEYSNVTNACVEGGQIKDTNRYGVLLTITCAYAPGTNDRLFSDLDMDTLLDLPASDNFIAGVVTEVMKLMSSETDGQQEKKD